MGSKAATGRRYPVLLGTGEKQPGQLVTDRPQVLIYPESASAVLRGSTRAWKSRPPPHIEQVIGESGSI